MLLYMLVLMVYAEITNSETDFFPNRYLPNMFFCLQMANHFSALTHITWENFFFLSTSYSLTMWNIFSPQFISGSFIITASLFYGYLSLTKYCYLHMQPQQLTFPEIFLAFSVIIKSMPSLS